VEVLILDDIGAGKPSAWALETVGFLLNKRYNERRTTLLTTNYLDVSARGAVAHEPSGRVVDGRGDVLAIRIGERIRSRLHEMCKTVEVAAPDFRQEIHKVGRARA